MLVRAQKVDIYYPRIIIYYTNVNVAGTSANEMEEDFF